MIQKIFRPVMLLASMIGFFLVGAFIGGATGVAGGEFYLGCFFALGGLVLWEMAWPFVRRRFD